MNRRWNENESKCKIVQVFKMWTKVCVHNMENMRFNRRWNGMNPNVNELNPTCKIELKMCTSKDWTKVCVHMVTWDLTERWTENLSKYKTDCVLNMVNMRFHRYMECK